MNQGSCLGPVFSGILNGWKAGGIQKTTPLLRSLTSLRRPHYQAKWNKVFIHLYDSKYFVTWLQRGLLWSFKTVFFKKKKNIIILGINTLFLFSDVWLHWAFWYLRNVPSVIDCITCHQFFLFSPYLLCSCEYNMLSRPIDVGLTMSCYDCGIGEEMTLVIPVWRDILCFSSPLGLFHRLHDEHMLGGSLPVSP